MQTTLRAIAAITFAALLTVACDTSNDSAGPASATPAFANRPAATATSSVAPPDPNNDPAAAAATSNAVPTSPTPAATPIQPTPSPSPNVEIIPSGTYLVPDEIDYGVYRVVGYWARLDSDFEIIDNDGVYDNGISIMVVQQNDIYIEISGESIPLADLPTAPPLALGFTEGTYLVGVDIEPGRYRISDPDYAYAARLDGSLDIIDNAGNSGNVIIEIAPSDFAFTYAGTITPLGVSASMSDTSATGTTSDPAESDVVDSAALGSGTYLVPDEINYGMYRVVGYWARLGSDFSIIDNDGVYGNGIGLVVVQQDDAYLEISGEATPIADIPTAPPLALGYTEGTYLVGVDIEPGRYRISDPDYAYAARLDSSLDIINNAGNSGSVIIEIHSTDYAFTFTGTIDPL